VNRERRLSPTRLAALAAAVLLAADAAPGASPAAHPAAAPAPGPGAAFIHGTVTLRDGAPHTGFVRWRDEDAFWDDTFSATQVDPPWFAYADREALVRERRQLYYQSHGLLNRLAWAMHQQDERAGFRRSFVCRYGDLVALRVPADDDKPTVAVLKDGREVAIEEPSRDLGSDLLVYAGPGDPVELDWDEVREIRFDAAPPGATPYAQRLAGTVEFAGGKLSGTVQWDTSECTSLDELDGDEQDVSMADVRRVARNRRGGCDVTLADGRTLALSGTNDVGDGNRGAAVMVAGLGRVIVPWSRLVAADLQPVPATAPAYDDFPAARPLRGTVTTTDGRALSGRLVYDLDESTTGDVLHGALDERDYEILFGLVAAIVPAAPGACDVTLRDGQRLTLSGDEDTGEGNAGLLVFADGAEKPVHLPWSAVRRLDFTP
jgi:hypothetical protein